MSSQPIQLYSLATPNGQKVSVALEEMELPYEPHIVNILKNEQFSDWFRKINPNSKIPAIVDPDGPDGEELAMMESGAILTYLAEKSGKFLAEEPRQRNMTLQWLFFQVGHIGPMFGQFGHFYRYGKDKCDHPYPLERYTGETRRLLAVLEEKLASTSYVAGDDYSIADMAIFPWVNCLSEFYEATEHLGLKEFSKVNAWVQKCIERPATQKGMHVCPVSAIR